MEDSAATSNHKWLKVLAAVLVLALMGSGVFGYWYLFMRGIVYSDDARFNGRLVDLAPTVSGRLLKVNFGAGEAVRKGDIAFELDASTLRSVLAREQAALITDKGTLAVAQAQYDRALHGARPEEIKAAEADAARLAAMEAQALLELHRVESLSKTGVATQADLDQAQTAYESAKQAYASAAQDLQMLQTGTRPEDIAAAKAQVAVADGSVAEQEAAVAKAQLDIDHTVVKTPFDGWVVRRWLEPGAAVSAAQSVLTVFDPSTLRVDANIEEKYLHSVAVGDKVDISVDAYPDMHLVGRVREILRATNSEFSLIPAEGVSGTYVKVSQRVPLRISVESQDGVTIGPGLSVEVKIHIGSAPREGVGALAHE